MSIDPRYRQQTEPPSPVAVEQAKNELRETPELVQSSLAELRKLLDEDATLHFKTDDDTLLIFLRPCKFYAQSAYELMKRAADFKVKYASTIKDLMPDDEKATLLDHKIVNVLANRDQHGRRVLIANLGSCWDTKNISGDQVFRLFYMIHILAMGEPETQIRGVVVILDFDGLGMKQVAQLTPSFSMRLLSFIQEAMPLRLKEVHIVRQPFIFNVVWKVFSPFIQQKLKGRIHFHGSKYKDLHAMMGKEQLPGEYGGDLAKLDYSSKDWYPTLKACESQIREWNTWGRKEST
ncbi:SEC14 [Nesidiocoris tenuis]|uniref:SEC14 n=1 Tax=Nesidiocoris tenuis TaxID=355587 RepID=A0ABN7AEH2_9HEMI|nr:SEC14 [Nesidiocoris tenuis]